MDSADKKTEDWKVKLYHGMVEYGFNVIYLTFVFAAFTEFRRLLLASYDISYTEYGYAIIEALILGKVIMIGGVFHLGRGLEDKPLIYPTLYKTVVFTIFVALFKVIEYGLKGIMAGEGITGGFAEFGEKGAHLILANSLMVFVALIPFFAMKELGRIIGRAKIGSLFFRQRNLK